MKKNNFLSCFLLILAAISIAYSADAEVKKITEVKGHSGSCTRGGLNPLKKTLSCWFPILQDGQRRFDTYYTNMGRIEYQSGVGATVIVYTPTTREVSRCQINQNNRSCNLSHQGDGHLEVVPDSDGQINFLLFPQ